MTLVTTDALEELQRDGLTVLRGFLDPARTDRLREVADGLRAQYLRRDPLTGRQGFLSGSWHVETIQHPGFYEGAPDWWRAEMLDLIAEPRILDFWRALSGIEPAFVRASLFMDPPLPYALDRSLHAEAAPDGAGHWHRDVPDEPDDEVERAALLSGALRRDDGYLLEIALLPSDAFEYVPGSHLRFDTPAELAARKRATTVEERTRALPGGCRVPLEAGDAVLVDGTCIHRGWYTHGVARRTIALWYLAARYLSVYPAGDVRLRCFVEAEELERLRPATAAFFGKWRALSEQAR